MEKSGNDRKVIKETEPTPQPESKQVSEGETDEYSDGLSTTNSESPIDDKSKLSFVFNYENLAIDPSVDPEDQGGWLKTIAKMGRATRFLFAKENLDKIDTCKLKNTYIT